MRNGLSGVDERKLQNIRAASSRVKSLMTSGDRLDNKPVAQSDGRIGSEESPEISAVAATPFEKIQLSFGPLWSSST